MGVYFSQEFGYGIGGTYNGSAEDLPGLLSKFAQENEDFMFNEEVQRDVLNLPEGVVFDVGGDFMSGPYRWSLIIKSTHVRIDKYEAPVISFLKPLDAEDCMDLVEAMSMLDLDGTPGWMVMCNVS